MNAIRRDLRRLSIIRVVMALVTMLAPMSAAQSRMATRRNVATPEKQTSQARNSTSDRFTLVDNGRTLHDNLLRVTWLLDANVGKSECKSVANVGSGGGMAWSTAWACVRQLNSGKGLLGHTNWQMPATPMKDPSCGAVGPQGNSFGENCRGSAYGSLFYTAWKRHFGETVALQTGPTTGGFKNLQPTLYWFGNSLQQQQSGKTKKNPYNGYNSFSFSNGWQGANVEHHVMYALPVIAGPVPAGSPAASATIWDPAGESGVPGKSGITWLADANIASDPHFLQQVKAGALNVKKDGSMDQATAQQLITLMRQSKYLHRGDWMLPLASAANCNVNGKTGGTDGYDCNVSGMGHLYYSVLKLSAGAAVAEPSDMPEAKPFVNVQPSLYWACTAAVPTAANPQAGNLCNATPAAADGFGFSFDMGSGFTDTTVIGSDLYLMVYYPDPPTKCSTPVQCCMQAGGTWSGGRCQ